MGRKLGTLLAFVALALSVPAFADQGSISGVVKNSAGTPQMGVLVQIFSHKPIPALTAFTDSNGFYNIGALLPGTYDVKVSAPSFLPTLRESINLHSGANLVINLTLNTLNDAIRFLPAKQSAQDDDDWKWTLRSAANRPILRMRNGEPVIVANGNRPESSAAFAFVAGSDGDAFGGSSEMSTRFKVERSLFQSGLLSFNGNVGYGSGANATVLRTSYKHRMPDGSTPEVSLTVHRFAVSPNVIGRDSALDAVSLQVANTFSLAEFIDLRVGSELQSVQFLGRVNAWRPFGSVELHASPDTVLEFDYRTSLPNMRAWKGFDTAPADLSESGPRVTMVGGRSRVERSHHQEISLSHRMGRTAVQMAYFHDHLGNAALTGVGNVPDTSWDILPDVYSGTFSYDGGTLTTNGMRVVVQRKFSNGLTATANYAFGGVLELGKENPTAAELPGVFQNGYRHSVAAKLSGTIARSKTQWLTSYKWTNANSLTPVDLFNAGPGQTDSFVNFFVRQPLPGPGFVPGKFEAIVDVRNLLAQGYQPVVGPDGQTLYLVQAPRSVRGGVAFVF